MRSVFNDIFYGDFSPADLNIPRSPEYRRQRSEFIEKSNQFTQVLKEIRPDLEKQFEALWVQYGPLEVYDQQHLFYQGLSLGIILVLEAFSFQQQKTE